MFRKFAYSILCIIIFGFLPYNQLFAREQEGEITIISERVGEVIDLEERNKYNLFPGVKGLLSAVFLKLPNGNYILKITHIDEKTNEEQVKLIPCSEAHIELYKIKLKAFKKWRFYEI